MVSTTTWTVSYYYYCCGVASRTVCKTYNTTIIVRDIHAFSRVYIINNRLLSAVNYFVCDICLILLVLYTHVCLHDSHTNFSRKILVFGTLRKMSIFFVCVLLWPYYYAVSRLPPNVDKIMDIEDTVVLGNRHR